MGVEITYLDDKQSEYLVDYGAKRKFRYALLHTDLDAVQFSLLTLAYEQTLEEVDRKTLARMNSVSVYKLVERLATEFCFAYLPMKEAGLPKKYIRQVILQALHEIQGPDEGSTEGCYINNGR
jgi:hypothetical protein